MLEAPARHDDVAVDHEVMRDRRLDFVRGICLWMVFLDHIPANTASLITIRNYSFCDAADVFVFVSGFSCAIGYGAIARKAGFAAATVRILRRAWQFYLAQLVLVLLLFAEIIWLGGGQERYMHEMNIGPLLNTPGPAAIWSVTFEYRPVNTDVYPTMFLLRLAFPAVLWLMFERPSLILGASVLLYALCHAFHFNIPTLPRGDWYFNPFAWQLLVVVGAWCALYGSRLQSVVASRGAIAVAIAFIAFAAFVTIAHQVHDAGGAAPNALERIIFPIDKSNLGVSRLFSLLALLIVGLRVIPRDPRILNSRLGHLAICCGERPLQLFSLSVLLSFAAHIVLVNVHENIPVQFAVSIAGIVIMMIVGVALSRAQQVASRQRNLA
jgi:hypothetical protein